MTVSVATKKLKKDITTMELKNDMKVLKRGERVLNIWHWHIPAVIIDHWVRMVALVSGQRLDWFYDRDRVVVKALGNIRKAKNAIEHLLPKLWAVALEKFSHQRSLSHDVCR